MPGYAITFARLRPHDIAFYRNPERIIKGETRPSLCYLDNDIIARRHIFAVALSEYFRYRSEHDGVNLSRRFYDFLDLESAEPSGLAEFKAYLNQHPTEIASQLADVFSSSKDAASRIGVDGWEWIDDLVGNDEGRLTRAHLVGSYTSCRRWLMPRLDSGGETEKAHGPRRNCSKRGDVCRMPRPAHAHAHR